MKTNVRLKGNIMLSVLVAAIFVWSFYFQDTLFGMAFLTVVVLLIFAIVYWIESNTNKKQFERIVKKAVGDDLLYFIDGSAAVDMDSITIYYWLNRNRLEDLAELKNDVMVNFSCALPVEIPADESFCCIKQDLTVVLDKVEARSVSYKCRAYSFDVCFELQLEKFSVPLLQQLQQSLAAILINKYHLHSVKRCLKSAGAGPVYYWEFVGFNAVRMVSYNLESRVWDYDDEDVYDTLSDIDSDVTVITEKEFEVIYEQAKTMNPED